MAETLKFNIPNEVVNADWKDDIDVDYATYKNEGEYVSPEKISKESLRQIKMRKVGIKALGLAA